MTTKAPRPSLFAFPILLLAVVLAVACWVSADPSAKESDKESDKGDPSVIEAGDWQQIDTLISEQKFQAALERLEELLAEAREAGDAEGQARALITATQLRVGLHGYETAVEELQAAEWPDEPVAQVALRLYYAQSLVVYYQGYSWEIDQRDRVDTGEKIDLKAWTKEQIYEEARQAYREIWQGREKWGAEPVGRLAPYLNQNSYPARIRGTLRDTVTYLWVDLLANTGFWSAEESNGVYRLDRDALLRKAESTAGEAEEDLHPLLQLTRLLGDLEAWHQAADRPEAAFEARLERLRRLSASLTQEDDRQALRGHLEERLEALGSRYEWWSVGMAQLAELVRGGSDSQALVEAREIALEGVERHPDTIGGRRCRHIVETIELPAYRLTSMLTDGPRRRSLQVRHKNIEKLYFRAYRYDLEERLAEAQDYNLLPGHREVEETVRRRTPVARWQMDLPATPDYRDHNTYVTPPMTEPGAYLVVASMGPSFAPQRNRRAAVNFLVTDLVLVHRYNPEKGVAEEAVVRSGATGKTVAGAEVVLYRFEWQKGHHPVRSVTTGNDGLARFNVQDAERRGARFFFFARKGDQVTVDQGALHLWERPDPPEQTAALLYTDRSIYRPGQTLHWKVVAYHGDSAAGRFRTLSERSVTVNLLDANGEQVADATVTTNEFGTASGDFTLPAGGRLLGAWRLTSSYGGDTIVRVEEYKRPTFEVNLEDPEEALRLNRPARFRGEARYYFGLPVSEGEATWRVVREPVYPPWWFWYSWYFTPDTSSEVVAAGTSAVNADGTFDLTFIPEADERQAENGTSYRYRVEVELTDEGGETRSATRSFRLGFVAVEAAFPGEAGFYNPTRPTSLTVRRTDLDGIPRVGEGQWELFRLAEPESTLTPAEVPLPAALLKEGAYRTPGDELRPRWNPQYDPRAVLREWEKGKRVARGTLRHDDNGEAEVEMGNLPAGTYRLTYTTRDAFGAEYTAHREFVVTEDGASAPALPALLTVENDTVAVGGTARVLVSSGLNDQELALETYRGGRRIERRILRSNAGSPQVRVIEIPITAEYRGGFGLTLTAVRDHQLMSLEERVFVPWDDRRLSIELATFRDRLRPGDREQWRVVVRGEEGALEAGAAEVLAYLYDKSLDLFAPHHPVDPLNLYPRRTGVVRPQSTLSQSTEIWRREEGLRNVTPYPQLQGDTLKMLGGYAIGGMGRRVHRGTMRMKSMAAEAVPAPAAMAPTDAVADMEVLEEAAFEPDMQVAGEARQDAGGAEESGGEVELRTNFAETAFWEPHLVVDADGAAVMEFTVPDSVTEWSFWTHAVTPDLRAGSHNAETRSVKELLVRPYLPRFFREGDQAEIRVVVNNTGEEALSGTLDFELLDADSLEGAEVSVADAFGLDPETTRDVPFTVEAGGGTTLRFPLSVPPRVGLLAFRVTARADDFSDGELRPLPVLPGRMHLMQSRFAVVKDAGERTLRFADLAADDDPTRIDEQLVVTLDAQLFYGVLSALPYLVEYPYECTEQTLNRFLSTGIVTSVFDRYPAVAAMARKMAAERDTRLETWDADDPNRKMALEETPWLRLARGGGEEDLIKVLDPEIATAERRTALAQLEQVQTSLGGFPWWPGGPPSPYMTLYLLYGFSKALEFDVEVPQPMVRRAWAYMHRHYLDELVDKALKGGCCVEFVTFLNFVLSSYPEQDAEAWTGGVFTSEDQAAMLDFSFKHWKRISPLIKGYLTLTLQRAGRNADANLVFDSVMDSAKTEEDLGTYWAPEDRAWLWYNDTIESHAFALRVLAELDPDDPRRDGLVQWLFLNKHLNHWKSTRATAEVIYSLVHYLDTEGTLGAREEAKVAIADQRWEFTFEPDEYTGKDNHIVIKGDEAVGPETAEIHVSKETPGYLFASATWHFSTEKLPEEARGDFFGVTRRYFKRVQQGEEWVLLPLADGAHLEVGDQVEVQLSLTAKHAAEYVHLRDPRGAGFEPETLTSGYKWNLGIGYYEEIRDSGTNFFFDWLPVGEYTFKYRLRAATAGIFKVAPATVQPMYAPEFAAYSSGARIGIAGE